MCVCVSVSVVGERGLVWDIDRIITQTFVNMLWITVYGILSAYIMQVLSIGKAAQREFMATAYEASGILLMYLTSHRKLIFSTDFMVCTSLPAEASRL